jgi:hypothetical protein
VNKSIPTLLGIVIILLVVVLVVLIFNYQLTQKLGAGETVVGTVGGKALTGVEPPKEEIGTSEVLGAREPESQPVLSPALRPGTRAGERAAERQGGQRRAGRQGARRGPGETGK